MKESTGEIAQRLGVDRVLDPPGSLPQPAARLDPSGPCRPHEIEVEVERLCLDSTSHREIRAAAGGDPDAMGARILQIVSERGKLHNPETDSGGVLTGTVSAVGAAVSARPEAGQRIVTLASLTLTPLRLEAIDRLDPDSPQVEVSGTAYVFDRAPWARDAGRPSASGRSGRFRRLRRRVARSRARPGAGTVTVLGAGHAGKMALAAARDAAPAARSWWSTSTRRRSSECWHRASPTSP